MAQNFSRLCELNNKLETNFNNNSEHNNYYATLNWFKHARSISNSNLKKHISKKRRRNIRNYLFINFRINIEPTPHHKKIKTL